MISIFRFLFVFLLVALTQAGYSQCQWDKFKRVTSETTQAGRDFTDAINQTPSLIDAWKVLDDTGIAGLGDNLLDVKKVDEYLKASGKSLGEVTDDIERMGWPNWVDDIGSSTSVGIIRTLPSKTPNLNAVPRGTKTPIPSNVDDATRTSLIMENETADVLAQKGYDIEQNPSIPGTSKKPDYRIEGEIFDCYSPYNSDKSVRNIWTEVKTKIDARQTERVVVNLKNWGGKVTDLQKQFTDYHVENLKELMIIDKNNIVSHIEL